MKSIVDVFLQIIVVTLILIMINIALYNVNDNIKQYVIMEGFKKKMKPKGIKPKALKKIAKKANPKPKPKAKPKPVVEEEEKEDDVDAGDEEKGGDNTVNETEILDNLRDAYNSYYNDIKDNSSEMTLNQLMHDRAMYQTNSLIVKKLDELNENMEIERISKI